MSWKDNLRNEFFGNGGSGGSVQGRFVEVPPGHEITQRQDGGYEIVPFGNSREPGIMDDMRLVARELGHDTKSAFIGATGNAVVNLFGLLPDASEAKRLLRSIPPKEKKLERFGWGLKFLTKTLAVRVMVGTPAEVENAELVERGKLRDGLHGVINDARSKRTNPDTLLNIAKNALGPAGFERALEVAESGLYRGGDVSADERKTAAKLQADVAVDPGVNGSDWMNNFIEQEIVGSFLGLGSALVEFKERRDLENILENPVKAAEGDEHITLVRQGPFQQIAAAMCGATGFNPKAVIGGVELFLDSAGKVVLREGVETRDVADSMETLVISTDKATHFENAEAFATRRVDFGVVGQGWINQLIDTVSTLGGREPLRSPGAIIVGRSGAGPEAGTQVTVASVDGIKKNIRGVIIARNQAIDRVNDIASTNPQTALDEGVFLQIAGDRVDTELSTIPRPHVVLSEAQKAQRDRDAALFKDAEMPFPDDDAMRAVARYTPEQQIALKGRVVEHLRKKGKDVMLADKVMAAVNRNGRLRL